MSLVVNVSPIKWSSFRLTNTPDPVRAQPASLDITSHALQPGVLGVNLGVE